MTKQKITGTKKQQQSIGLGKGNYAQIPNSQLPLPPQPASNRTQETTGTPNTFYKTT